MAYIWYHLNDNNVFFLMQMKLTLSIPKLIDLACLNNIDGIYFILLMSTVHLTWAYEHHHNLAKNMEAVVAAWLIKPSK